jgi:membrane protein YqaA with SNARE-associated domain
MAGHDDFYRTDPRRTAPASMLKRLYDRTMRLAARPDAIWWMAAISFIESSVFPIPPDVLMIPMILAARNRAWWIATVCTVSSVLGGFLGYAIGYFAFETIGRPVLEFYGAMDKYESVKATFDHWGAWFIIVKGATPIPYKLVTIFAGTVKFDLAQFALSSLISRALRFFLLAALLWWFGPPIRDFIERRLTLVTTLFVVALVGGFIVIRYLF